VLQKVFVEVDSQEERRPYLPWLQIPLLGHQEIREIQEIQEIKKIQEG
jgi:hypothetical protein